MAELTFFLLLYLTRLQNKISVNLIGSANKSAEVLNTIKKAI